MITRNCRLCHSHIHAGVAGPHICGGHNSSNFAFIILFYMIFLTETRQNLFQTSLMSDGVLAMQRQQRQNYSHHQATTFIKQFQGRQEKVLSVHSLPIQRRTNSESCNCNDSHEYVFRGEEDGLQRCCEEVGWGELR